MYIAALLICRLLCIVYCFLMGTVHWFLSEIPLAVIALRLKAKLGTAITFFTLFLLHLQGFLSTLCSLSRKRVVKEHTTTAVWSLHSVRNWYLDRFGLNGVYFEIRILLLKLVELPMQTYQGYLMSTHTSNVYLPTGFAFGIFCNCCYLIGMATRARRGQIRIQILLMDISIDIILGAVLPLIVVVPPAYTFIANQRVMYNLDWAAVAVSSSQYLLVTSHADLLFSAYPLITSHFMMRSIQKYLHLKRASQKRVSAVAGAIMPRRKADTLLTKRIALASQRTLKLRKCVKLIIGGWIFVLALAMYNIGSTSMCLDSRVQPACKVYTQPWFTFSNKCTCLSVHLDCSKSTYYANSTTQKTKHLLGNLLDPNALYIKLKHCTLPTAPKELENFKGMLGLELANVSVEKLDINFTDHYRLFLLNMKGSKFTILPESLKSLGPYFAFLVVDGSPMSTLPMWIVDSWPNLAFLTLKNSKFYSIPSPLTQMQVKYLVLEGNQLTEISDSISKFTNLEALRVSNNSIAHVSPEIVKLASLKLVALTDNNISSLPWPKHELLSWNNDTSGFMDLSYNPICDVNSPWGIHETMLCEISCMPLCDRNIRGNLVCNDFCNYPECNYDDGDCPIEERLQGNE